MLNLFPFIILTSDLSILFLIFLSAAFACIDSREGAKAANVSAFSYNRFCMIARLKGTVIEKSTQRLLLDVGGVGYEVMIPLSTFYELPEPGKPVSLRIYTHVREDTLALFGFLTGKEKTVFTHLIQISGIGPKMALTILSGATPAQFRQRILDGDVRALTLIPGIGQKTAQRIIVELREKIGGPGDQLPEGFETAFSGQLSDEALKALLSLGYRRSEALKALRKASEQLGADASVEQILKSALKNM